MFGILSGVFLFCIKEVTLKILKTKKKKKSSKLPRDHYPSALPIPGGEPRPVHSLCRAGVLVLREGGPQQARVAALLLPAPHHLPRGPWLGLAALRPQRTLGGALPAHAPGRSRQAQVPDAGLGGRVAKGLKSCNLQSSCLGLHPSPSLWGK